MEKERKKINKINRRTNIDISKLREEIDELVRSTAALADDTAFLLLDCTNQ